ncbi:MAG: metallophosphoesterase [Actinomycetota bacterium]|nr:metallophosphoesterase [Actinomycetota bacterium]
MRLGLSTAATTVASIGAACAGYATLVERRWYRVRRDDLDGALTSHAQRPLRLLLVADLHLSPPDLPLQMFLAGLDASDIDLVVAAGDLVGAPGAEHATVAALAPLTEGGVPGVAVLGANDLYGPVPKNPLSYLTHPDRREFGARLNTDALRDGLHTTGWTTLVDERATITTAAGPVEVVGLLDPHLPSSRLPPRTTIAARDPEAVARLGIVHAPYTSALDLLTSAGYAVILAGHTHGGQVRVPGIGAVVTNCDLPNHQARGTSRWPGPEGRNAWLHVTAGVGQSRYAPFRFGCRPEVSVLELHR